MKKRVLTVILIFLLSLLFLPAIFAEVVILRDGTKIQGELIEQTDKYIKIETHGLPLMFPKDVVSAITADPLEPIEYEYEDEVEEPVIPPTEKPETGEHEEYYPSGELKAVRNYKDGKLDGISRDYFKNGQLQLEQNFREGKADGNTLGYYRDGSLRSDNYYRNGKAWRIESYYRNGDLKVEFLFEGDKEIRKGYYTGGRPMYVDTYVNHKLINAKSYDKDGNLRFDGPPLSRGWSKEDNEE